MRGALYLERGGWCVVRGTWFRICSRYCNGVWLLAVIFTGLCYLLLFSYRITIMGSKRTMDERNVCQLHIAISSEIRSNSQNSLLDYKLQIINKLSIPFLATIIHFQSCILHLFLFKSPISELSFALDLFPYVTKP